MARVNIDSLGISELTWTGSDRLILFFAAKDGEALYSQQKQDQELTVAQIMTPYCQIQIEIEVSKENH